MDFTERLRKWVVEHWRNPATCAASSSSEERTILGEFALRDIAAEIALTDGGRLPSLAFPALGGYPKGGPTIVDVLLVSILKQKGVCVTAGHECCWKVTEGDCIATGCRKVPESVMLVPDFSADIIKAVHDFVPDEIRVQPQDSVSSLVSRLSASQFLDDMHVPRKGRGGYVCGTERLNKTSMPQPRRVTMSVRVSPNTTTDDGETNLLFDYKNFRSNEVHKQTRPMPGSVFDLGVSCWLAAYEYLTTTSRSCPFTHCQLLIYYECLGGKIGQHRDNTNTKHLSEFLAGSTSSLLTALGPEESQVLGTSVVVFSLGTGTMQFLLRYPHGENLHEKRQDYVIHERFRIPLGPGTLFVLDPWDDLFFTHEACFEIDYDEVGESMWREAYVFRHVGSPSLFHTAVEQHKLYMSHEIRAKIARRKRARVTAKTTSRRKLLQSMF